MRYEIRDALIGTGQLNVDVIPMADAEGVMLRASLSADKPRALELAWAFGGASGLNQRNLDTCGYCPESVCWLKPEDCENNEFRLTEEGFELHAPCHQSRSVVGTMPSGARLLIADAEEISSPTKLLTSQGEKRPILAGRRAIKPGEKVFFAIELLSKDKAAGKRSELCDPFTAAEARRKRIAERVRVSAPDPMMKAAAASGLLGGTKRLTWRNTPPRGSFSIN